MKKLIKSRIAILISVVSLCATNLTAQNVARTNAPPGEFDRAMSALRQNAKVRRSFDYLKQIEPETVEEQIRITEIPAPTFNETKRAEYFRRRFTELGLQNVRVDKAGNAIGERPGKSNKTTLVLAAHLDTVFDQSADVKVKRDGNILKAPGISDDGRGLTLILAIAKSLNEAKIETEGTIIFVANVAEEGLGDLKGTRHLFDEELKGRITHFISIDGGGLGITHAAVGSYRYRTTFRGAGGHSYGAFGLPNPIHALGRLIEKVARFEVPSQPKTTFNVGKIAGGTSVNSIAQNAVLEVDMRSENRQELAKLDAAYKQAVQEALNEENERWQNKEKLTVENTQVGNRPTGAQNTNAPIVQIAVAADRALNIESNLEPSSTDSNVPISLGIPAITIDGGGAARGTHSLEEAWDSTDSYLGSQRALLIVLAVVGVK
ncbi:MAG TPA: M20/M25/M40 family metallo-hydrolase [Pyrinomonadaceae bacterium]|nr:M20/M25/M40 family metallo-hydrolase [Pyrinomonadaceae bacterium]